MLLGGEQLGLGVELTWWEEVSSGDMLILLGTGAYVSWIPA